MTPGSSFGSPYPLTSVDAALSQQSQAIISDSIADQLRDWNRARGRNLAWVEQAVQSGVILTNEQAIATNPPAIDLVAVDQQQLLLLLDGRMVQMASGSSVQLATLGRNVMPIAPTLTETAWQLLAEPNTAFALLVLGVLAIYLEFAAPGTTFFAGIGVVMVIGAAIGLFALPIQGWAIGLIILALILLGLEFVVVSHGGFTVAGLILLAVAGLNLIDPLQAPGASVAPSAVAVVVLGLAGVVGAGIGLALRTRSQPIATGSEALVGRLAEVRQRLDPQGMVFIDGALWQAICEEGAAEPGDWVRVQAVHRLRLIVRPIERTE
jgi:membrane-bound serine protease (ClpP class)